MQKKSGSSRVLTRTGGLVIAVAAFGGLVGCGQTSTTDSTTVTSAEAESTGTTTSSADQASTSTGADGDTSETAADVSIDGMAVDVHRDPG